MLIFHDDHKMTSKLSVVCVRSGQTMLQRTVTKLLNTVQKSSACTYPILQTGTSLAVAYSFEARTGYSAFQKKEN